MASAVRSGTKVGAFRVESLVGEGATGAVYLAEDTQRGGRVALKVLAPELAQDGRFRRRFLRESRLAAGLDHPHRFGPFHLDVGETFESACLITASG